MKYLLLFCFLGSILNGCLRTGDDLEPATQSPPPFTIGEVESNDGAETITLEDPATVINWVFIPAGSFMMGSEVIFHEQPIHPVTVESFQMSETEVTVAQYRQCVESGWCTAPTLCDEGNPIWTSSPSDKEDHPINSVDWGQARNFAV